MGDKFEEYLDKGTKTILSLFSSTVISNEERNAIVSAFTDALSSAIGTEEIVSESDRLIYTTSVRFIDNRLSQILAGTNSSYREYEEGIELCNRQQGLVRLFGEKQWPLPGIDNSNLGKCSEILRKRQESTSIASKILEEDKALSETIELAQATLSVRTCEQALALNHDLEQDISICKKKHLDVPQIMNKDFKKNARQISEIKRVSEQKEALHKQICDIDLQIASIANSQKASVEQWSEVTSLCKKQSELFEECRKKQWPIPTVRIEKPEETAKQYSLYIKMKETDNAITQERGALSTKKQFKSFFNHCASQESSITTCVQNGWRLPVLANPDPGTLSNQAHELKVKRDKDSKRKRDGIFAGIILVALLGAVIFASLKYKEGKIQIPFDSTYVNGQNLDVIVSELEKAGFEHIVLVKDEMGWTESGHVAKVSIDNTETYSKGTYKKPGVSVTVTYSSEDRLYVTDLLKGWNTKNYLELAATLKEEGFTNVTLRAVTTPTISQDKLVASLTLNGKDYTNERCFLPFSAPIIINYYNLQLAIGNDSAEFVGRNYEEVVADLEQSGFTNVQTQMDTTGWGRENGVTGVTVNNVDTYDSSQSFSPDVKIVVKYSSPGRVDVTEIVERWQKTDYEVFVASLKKAGFSTVKLTEVQTTKKAQNRLLKSISFDGVDYVAGGFFLHKSTSIRIEYYSLQITIGKSAKDFENNQLYGDIVKDLQSMGFTNIKLQRANDLVTGWHSKEGTLKSISINGNDDFASSASFSYDSEIVLIVHTWKNKGCEDITEIAK